MGIYTRAMGALLAVNTQVAVLIWGAFWLDEQFGGTNLKSGGIFVLAGLAVLHSYYVMFSYLLRLDQKLRGGKKDQGGNR